MSELYRDFIDQKADQIINSLGGTITPAPGNAELYRDFLDRKFDDVINACNGLVKLKSFTYTGTGSYNNARIVFPNKPILILSIEGMTNSTTQFSTLNPFTLDTYGIYMANVYLQGSNTYRAFLTKISDTELKIDNPSGDPKWSMNTSGVTYTVYYI